VGPLRWILLSVGDSKPVEFRGSSLEDLLAFPLTERREAGHRVWDAIENTPEQAANMRLRSELMIALKDHIARAGMSQAQAAQLFGVTQPRVSDLMRGKINLFALDALVNMATAAGLRIEMHVVEAA
jgi:predicted XRE-type DNA-binding protein